MKEPLREMISAVVDGEASEFEYRRVIESLDEAGTHALLGRHYTVRALVRSEAQMLCPPALTTSIFAALEAEPGAPVAGFAARWRLPLGGVAVAASVCMAAVIGLRSLAPGPEFAGNQAAATVVAGSSLGSLGRAATAPMHVAGPALPVGFSSAAPGAGAMSRDPGVAGANQLAEQRLHLFMSEHVRNAALNTSQGMMPYARVVGYQNP